MMLTPLVKFCFCAGLYLAMACVLAGGRSAHATNFNYDIWRQETTPDVFRSGLQAWERKAIGDELLELWGWQRGRREIEPGLRCRDQLFWLGRQLTKRLPHLPNRLKSDNRDIRGSYRIHVEGVYFADLLLCARRYDMAVAFQALAKLGVKYPRYKQKLSTHDLMRKPPAKGDKVAAAVQSMSFVLHSYFMLMLNHYPPAMMDLAELGNRGVLFRPTPAFQYFLVEAARRGGVKNDNLARLHAQAVKGLSPPHRADVDKWVTAKHWPRKERALLD